MAPEITERVQGRVVRPGARVRDPTGAPLGRVLRVDPDGVVVSLRQSTPSESEGDDLTVVRRCLDCGAVQSVPVGVNAAGCRNCGAAPTALVPVTTWARTRTTTE
jgi:hypothetical protein